MIDENVKDILVWMNTVRETCEYARKLIQAGPMFFRCDKTKGRCRFNTCPKRSDETGGCESIW